MKVLGICVCGMATFSAIGYGLTKNYSAAQGWLCAAIWALVAAFR